MRRSAAVFLVLTLLMALPAGCSGGTGAVVPTARVTRGELTATVSVSGNLKAPNSRTVAFALPGTVEAVLVQQGDAVDAGQVLAQLDSRQLQRNVDLARTQLEQARAQYNIADQQLRATLYPNYYGSYVVDIPSLWLALDTAEERVGQVRELIARGDVAEANVVLGHMLQDLDEAKFSAQARDWDLPAQIKAMEYQREAAKIAITAAEVNLQGAREMLEDATVTAPAAGVVTAANVKAGDVLTQATFSLPAFQLVDPTNLEMTGLIDEMDVVGISLGQEVVVTLDALAGVELAGKVSFISDAALVQAGVVLYPTTIILINPDGRVKDGMSATADIVIERRSDVLTLPAAAVFREQGRSVVYAIDKAGKVAVREVSTGLRSGRLIEVVSGLEEGDEVSLELR